MDQILLDQTIRVRRNRLRRRRWRRVVNIMAMVVVFCTTYALILPAITMEQDAVCGIEAHEHTQECYGGTLPSVFACQDVPTEQTLLHTHEGLCFDEGGNLRCPLPEVIAHTHTEQCQTLTDLPPCTEPELEAHTHADPCWEISDTPLCGLEEAPAHTHDETCQTLTDTYLCGQEAHPAHTHSDDCYGPEPELRCGQEAQDAHIHGDGCYETQVLRTCGQEEHPAHAHSDGCYTPRSILSCTTAEAAAHTHGSSCYETRSQLSCTLPEDETHSHGDGCYTSQEVFLCTLAETAGHAHGSECYDSLQELSCGQAESAGHTHSEACNTSQQNLICTLPQTEGHAHSDSCYARPLLCTIPETPGHIHTDACRERQITCGLAETSGHTHGQPCYQKLICMLEETPGHAHTDSCVGGTVSQQTCPLPELQPHTHDESCPPDCPIPQMSVHVHDETCLRTEEDLAALLICGMEAHVHEEACYEPETLPTEEGYLCGFGSHTHTESCYGEDSTLICNIPEHVHNIQCVLPDYDPNADIESQSQWEATFASVSRTGHWPTDVLAIARTQLGYTESSRNCFLYEDGTIRGYTRYGAWYGSPYGDWCAMFVSFCLHYAGVEDFPLDAGCDTWAGQLQQLGRYHSRFDYTPKPGDLIFFDWEYAPGYAVSLDHVGLVAEITADGSIITIEGNSGNCVQYCTYAADDSRIIAYGALPEGNPLPQPIRQIYQGSDFTVTVTYDASAGLPEGAALTVREIPQDSEEYAQYYLQSAMALQNPDDPEAPVELAFARFFDISFLLDGQTIEPAAPVEISITYQETVEIPQENTEKVVHFADTGIEVLDAQTNASENQADTFTFTQDSFSVSGTVVMAAAARAIDLTGASDITEFIQSVKFLNSDGVESAAFVSGDEITIVVDVSVWAWRYQNNGGNDITLKFTPGNHLLLSSYTCTGDITAAQLDAETNTFAVIAPPTVGQWNPYVDTKFQVTLTATAVNETDSGVTVPIGNYSCKIYTSRQEFTTTLDDGTILSLELMGSNLSPDEYQVMIEEIDDSSYQATLSSYADSNFKDNYQKRTLEDSAVFLAYLQSKNDPKITMDIPAPYNLSVSFAESPVTVTSIGAADAVNLSTGNAQKVAASSAVHEGNSVTGITLSDANGSLSRFGILALSGMVPTSQNLSLTYNTVKDNFLRDPAYSLYYNANSPIGTAGSFHIVAFDTANLGTHTNGNVLAKNLYAGSNFGTNGYPYELTYVQNYLQINGSSASNADHVLALGSSNTLDLYDNGNRFQVNGTHLDNPKNVVQDVDTASAPFIDLNRVKAEIRQISANLAGYEDMMLDISYNSQSNNIALTNPDGVGILNVTPASPAVFGKPDIFLDGFQSGHNGSIVINVDCTGYSTIRLPNALVVVDGQTQGTAEVVEFSNGKVLWNFLNASGVTIEAQRMTGMVIAPGATVNINQNLNGTVVAENVNVKAESHRTDFTGKIVPQTEGDDEAERYITIQKIKSGYVGTTLADAQFDLHIWNGTDWEKVNTDTIITSAEGLFRLQDLAEDTAYRLIETKAPTGYILSAEPFFFWVRPNANATTPSNKPEGFTGTAVDSGGVLNIANEPDEQVQTTELTLKKEWVSTTLEPPTRISVDIYQIVLEGDEELERILYKTVTLTQILNWETTVTDLPLSGKTDDGTEVTYAYTVQEKPVPGFTSSYSENNARGITDDTILITNTETGDGYDLPETGGIGTHLYTFGGLLLIALALMYAILTLYKRRREDAY